MQLLFCLLLKSAIKSPARFDLDAKQGKMCHGVGSRKRFRSGGPSRIMEAKQTETVDLEMTSPACAPLPDARCREYLFFQHLARGARTLPFIAVYLFAKLCRKHIVSQDECETRKKDSKE